jgi:putative ABC transport system ATP-binding protein
VSHQPPQIEASNLARRHPDEQGWLLEGVTLSIEPGSRTSIGGPSGSGKTLLLRAVAMLDPLDAGEVRFEGRAIARDEIPAYRAKVIYLHQRPALLAARVEGALKRPFVLNIHRERSFSRARVVELLEQLGRDESFLAKPVAELSGGESQLVALLRAVQLEPKVLLLDEPTAGLDPEATAAVETLVNGWLAESPDSRSIVWVSHDAEQARRMGRRMVRIDAGRIDRGS